jgi:hypothetical protein
VTFNALGTCFVDLTTATTAEWVGSTYKYYGIGVNADPQNIYLSTATSPTVGDVAQVWATSDSGQPVSVSVDSSSSEVCTLSGNTITYIGAGSCQIDGSVAASGNYAAGTATDTIPVAAVVAPAVPTVTAVSPNTGPTSGGTSVTVTGTGFTGATAVLFGGLPGKNLIVVNDTTITVTAPANSAGAHNVQVTTTLGTSPKVTADTFTYQ